eukprot:14909-Pelagococcus_subviridis.AAC.2
MYGLGVHRDDDVSIGSASVTTEKSPSVPAWPRTRLKNAATTAKKLPATICPFPPSRTRAYRPVEKSGNHRASSPSASHPCDDVRHFHARQLCSRHAPG